MRQFIDVTGKTEDEAIQNALRQLGLDRDDVSVEILERAKSGFLGLGSCPAKVRVSYGPEEEEEVLAPAPAPKEKPQEERPKPPKAEKPPRQKAKITLDVICTMLRGVGTLLRAVFGAIRFTKISVCFGVRGDDPAAAARNYGKLQAWLYPTLGVLDHFFFLEFDQLRVLPDFGSAQPTVQDKVSFRVSAQALFIVIAAVRVLYEFWRKKVLDIFI